MRPGSAGDGAVLLITGTSSGIGRATALAAARAGFRTVATMREPADGAALRSAAASAGTELDVRRLDVTAPDSVGACVREVVRTYGRLDAVVNNAGVANAESTVEMSTAAVLRRTFEVNFFGAVAVTRAVLPWLRAARGRLVTVGSVHGVVGQPFNESYSAAKFAVEGFMESLAPVAAAHGVRVSVVVPGFVEDTNFGIFPDVSLASLLADSGPYRPTMARYVDGLRAAGWAAAAQSAAEVAAVIIETLRAERPPFRIPTGTWAADYIAAKLADVDGRLIQRRASGWLGRPDRAADVEHTG